MIRPLFGWLRGRTASEIADEASATRRDADDAGDVDPGVTKPGVANASRRTSSVDDAHAESGRAAGRREVAAIEALRNTTFVDREQAQLHTQLARAPRDVGALYGLLAWHARRGDREEMASFAHALWDETDAEGELWRKAAALGRTVDPHNPLYDENPFAALAAHAAQQPVRGDFALDQFDLSLPTDDRAEASAQPDDAVVSQLLHRSANTAHTGEDTERADGLASSDAPFFDIFSQPKGRLPASVLSLDMDLDLDTPPTESGDVSTWLAGLSSPTVSGVSAGKDVTAPKAPTPMPTQTATPTPTPTPPTAQPAWVRARPRRVRGRVRYPAKK